MASFPFPKERLTSSDWSVVHFSQTAEKDIIHMMNNTKKNIVLHLFVSVHQISLLTHANTNLQCWSALLRGFVGPRWNLHLTRQESTWNSNKGSLLLTVIWQNLMPWTCTTLLYTMGLRNSMHTHAYAHIHKGLCTLLFFQRSNIDLFLESKSGSKLQASLKTHH